MPHEKPLGLRFSASRNQRCRARIRSEVFLNCTKILELTPSRPAIRFFSPFDKIPATEINLGSK